MSEHVTEWLNAYLDGELKGIRLRQVEEHLASCETCCSDLDSLQKLTMLLQSDPSPVFPSPERFASQVNLLLPQKRTAHPKTQLFDLGWWMIPVGLVVVSVFISAAILLGNLVSVADQFGMLDSTTAAWISSQPESANVTETLGQFGFLKTNSLQWAEWSESYTRNIFPQFFWYASIAFAYLVWIVVWWARQTRQVQGHLVEG